MQYYYISPFKDFQKFCGYYHEYGDALIKDKFVKYPSKINIGVCGRAGSGKSTFLNVILGEKRCLEGQGQSVIIKNIRLILWIFLVLVIKKMLKI